MSFQNTVGTSKPEKVFANQRELYTDRASFRPATSTLRWDVLDRGIPGIVGPDRRAACLL